MVEPTNIIKVVQIVRSPAGGIRKHIESILENLDASRFALEVVTDLSYADKEFAHFCQSPPTHCKVLDFKIRNAPGPWDLMLLAKLFFVYREQRVSIFHGHGAKGGLCARILARILKAKSVYTPHGGSVHAMHGLVKNKIYALTEWLLYFLTDQFIFESKYTQDEYARRIHEPSKKFFLNPNGVKVLSLQSSSEDGGREYTQVLDSTRPNPDLCIATFGALRFIKGYDLVIEAVYRLQQSGLKVTYDLYGEGEEEQSLKKMVEEFKLQDRVRFKGDVANALDKMPNYDVILQPSRFESFGLTALEAMSLGVPVVCSNVGGLKEIVVDQKNGRSFASEDIGQLTKALMELARDPIERVRLGRSGHSTVVEKFDEKRMIANLKSVYLLLAGKIESKV